MNCFACNIASLLFKPLQTLEKWLKFFEVCFTFAVWIAAIQTFEEPPRVSCQLQNRINFLSTSMRFLMLIWLNVLKQTRFSMYEISNCSVRNYEMAFMKLQGTFFRFLILHYMYKYVKLLPHDYKLTKRIGQFCNDFWCHINLSWISIIR